jgi:hypothetical protein
MELQDYTIGDWIDAKTGMRTGAFNQLVKTAKLGGIAVPSVVSGNYNPRIRFESLTGDDTDLFQRVKDTESLNKFNAAVKAWGRKVETELKQSANCRFGHRISNQLSGKFPKLSDSITLNLKFDKQYKLETRSVGFTFARHGVYLESGAGKGSGGLMGSKWTNQYGTLKFTNDMSLNKMGTGERKAEDWFNDILQRNTAELADILAEYSLDMVLTAP